MDIHLDTRYPRYSRWMDIQSIQRPIQSYLSNPYPRIIHFIHVRSEPYTEPLLYKPSKADTSLGQAK